MQKKRELIVKEKGETCCQSTDRGVFPSGALLCALNICYACVRTHRTCASVCFLVCKSYCYVHVLYANLCEGKEDTEEAAAVWSKWASSGTIAKDNKFLSHSNALSV